MSKILDDVKSGLKGIQGAGEAVRGNLMEATDQAFEPNQHNPSVVDRNVKHEEAQNRGKREMEGADSMVARHEWKREERAAERQAAAGINNGSGSELEQNRISENANPGMAAPGIAAPAVPPAQVAEESSQAGVSGSQAGNPTSVLGSNTR